MKKIIRLVRRWRYRRLYTKLLLEYIHMNNSADTAGYQAALAFEWITGLSWKDTVERF